MKIHLETIPASEHRYPTIGDYWHNSMLLEPLGPPNMEFRVTAMSDWRAEAAVFLHEFVEAMLCKQRGVRFQDIDDFDKQFEARPGKGEHDEPGDDPASPYRKEHRFAENLERLFLAELGLHWDDYNKMCEDADT